MMAIFKILVEDKMSLHRTKVVIINYNELDVKNGISRLQGWQILSYVNSNRIDVDRL